MPILHFKGKAFLKNYHMAVPFHSLEMDRENSTAAQPTLDDNLIIHADNLIALKSLLPTHGGRVKCIYIDPPYNTGNEGWCYNDKVNSPMIRAWLGREVGTEDLERHDKWCCMMYPRLQLLRELLRDDGVIFVSIDDNEVAHLRMMLDEIFGEENFVSYLVWQKKYAPQNDAKYFSTNHDGLLCYAKQKEYFSRNLLPMTDAQKSRYKNIDNDPRGPWKSDNLSVATYNAATDFEIITPSGRKISPPEGYCWRFSKERLEELVKNNRIWFGPEGNNVPSFKRFLSEINQGKVPISIWYHDEVGHTQSATKELKSIFSGEKIFDYPKPVGLIKRCIQLSTNPGDIILDSFAGSGTTGHAVLALNAEEEAVQNGQAGSLNFDTEKSAGGRRFILIECEEYANTITAERIRRVAKGVPDAKDAMLRNGLGGAFSFCTLSPTPLNAERMLDGKQLPSFLELARHAFYIATGDHLDEQQIDEKSFYCGADRTGGPVYLLYQSDPEALRELTLNLDLARAIRAKHKDSLGRMVEKIVFAPQSFLEDDDLRAYGIRFCQLPFDIFRIV